jgi:hypothetical protein
MRNTETEQFAAQDANTHTRMQCRKAANYYMPAGQPAGPLRDVRVTKQAMHSWQVRAHVVLLAGTPRHVLTMLAIMSGTPVVHRHALFSTVHPCK